ncbi:HVA22-like protein k [Apium graveolens]|uniref:HVA22-like protein k n=1 Tax=Apium graveolens TaxID=4045 RepID=UPI003D7AF33D
MALRGSNEVGLRMLLYPFSTNIVVRTACCSVGAVLPVYSTFKAIETKDQNEQQRWLVYWAAYGSFTVAESFADKLISWFPLYYHMKLAFLIWLQLPSVNGARQLYTSHIRPFLLRHQTRLDQIVGVLYHQMGRFFSAREAELQFAKAIGTKIIVSANHIVRDIIHPNQSPANRMIEAPPRHEEASDSEHEE